ncbi:MAG: dihydroorotase [Bacillota bacterium]
MMKTLLENARVIDPEHDLNGIYHILIDGDRIKDINQEVKALLPEAEGEVNRIDLENKIILPGLIDMHTHLREPGFEEKETIKTGTEAAAAGGLTTIATMANTDPVADNPATVEFILSRSRSAPVRVLPIGSITKNMEGKTLSEIGFLKEAGVKALSDDGKPVMNSEIMRRAMEYARGFQLPIIEHCEDLNLSSEGVMNEGYTSTILGLKPIPAEAEEIMISRNLILAEMTGVHLHIAHVSTRRGLELITEARQRGIKVSAEVTPHHLVLTEEAVRGYDTNTKVNPPLRSESDRQALCQGLAEGRIDVIASDHAPHTFEDKMGEYDYAEFGISGLETELSLIYDRLIKPELLSWEQLVTAMVYNPASILGLDRPGICSGAGADLTVFDPLKKWTVDPEAFKSRGKNTPFAGAGLIGKPLLTMVSGNIVYDDRGDQGEIIY